MTLRSKLVAIAWVGGVFSVALCGSYGWDQGGAVLKDRVIQAVIYGMAAVFALSLHVAAIRIWREGWPRWLSALVGVGGFFAFIVTAWISLNGMASRSDQVVAVRQEQIDSKTDTKKQIADLEAEKAGMTYKWATQATVDAAKRAADAATTAKNAECGNGDEKQRGKNCRSKETAEADALNALTAAQANKATTDRVIQIDADLKRLRAEAREKPAVGAADTGFAFWKDAVGEWWAEVLTSVQKVVFVVTYDLCLLLTMIAIELIDGKAAATKSARREEPEAPKEPEAAPPQPEPKPEPVIAPRPRQVAKPKLVPSDGVGPILTKLLERTDERARFSFLDAANAYVAQCRSEGETPIALQEFIVSAMAYCKAVGIKTRTVGGMVYMVGVRPVQPEARTG